MRRCRVITCSSNTPTRCSRSRAALLRKHFRQRTLRRRLGVLHAADDGRRRVYGQQPGMRLTLLKQMLRGMANTILDIRLQTMGMTDQQALDLMINDTYQEKEEATAKLQRAQLSSLPVADVLRGLERLVGCARPVPTKTGRCVFVAGVPRARAEGKRGASARAESLTRLRAWHRRPRPAPSPAPPSSVRETAAGFKIIPFAITAWPSESPSRWRARCGATPDAFDVSYGGFGVALAGRPPDCCAERDDDAIDSERYPGPFRVGLRSTTSSSTAT